MFESTEQGQQLNESYRPPNNSIVNKWTEWPVAGSRACCTKSPSTQFIKLQSPKHAGRIYVYRSLLVSPHIYHHAPSYTLYILRYLPIFAHD
jgi:hypothetical protein